MSRSVKIHEVTLRNWAVRPGSDNPFAAPELVGIRVSGKSYGHPRFPDGKTIATSRVATVAGRRVVTESGTVYLLEGDPEPEYLDWLKTNGRTYDPERPIVVRLGPGANR